MSSKPWAKSIPVGRDWVQSQALAWGIGLFLTALNIDVLRWVLAYGGQFPVFATKAFALSVAFALIVRGLRAATVGGAVSGGMVCLLLTFWTGIWTNSIVRSGLTPLLLLFLLTFVATRAGRKRKAQTGLAESRRGRNAAQVIANLSVAGICSSPLISGMFGGETSRLLAGNSIWVMMTVGLAALVEATADTVSSEIGQAFGGQPVLLTSLRRVAVGTDGAVTVMGSLAGIVGGAVVAFAGTWAMHLSKASAGVALMSGVCGLFFDSLVGATLERRGWLGNDLVNFASTVFAAALAAFGCYWLKHS